MTISLYKGLTRNPEIENPPVWVLSNIRRLGRVRNTKFGTNVSNKMILNVPKCQGYSFYRFWVIKRKPTGWRGEGGGEGVIHIYTQTRVNVRFPSSKKVDFICFNESLLKVMKKVFCFILKPFLFWRYWHLCPDLFGQVGKRIDKRKQISKFMTSSNGKLVILIYMLPIFQEVKAIRQWNLVS